MFWLNTFATNLVASRYTSAVIIAAILGNCVVLGLETYPELHSKNHDLFNYIECGFLVFFSVELTVRYIAARADFWHRSWNWFDLIVLTASWVAYLYAAPILGVIRVLRIIGIVRKSSEMQQTIQALAHAIKYTASVLTLSLIHI